MDQIECPRCGEVNDANQYFCSECRLNLHLKPAKRAPDLSSSDEESKRAESDPTMKWVVGFLVALAILWPAYSVYRFNNPRPVGASEARAPSSPSRSSAPSGGSRIDGEHWFGCIDRDYFKKVVGYAAVHDTEAFSKALAAGLIQGSCTRFTAGEAVYLADTAIFSGLVKVRRKGEILEYWTNLEAVD